MRALLVIGAALLCAASATSYERATTATPLAGGKWVITVEGNQWTKNADVMRYVNMKASEVCPGGYDFEQQMGGVVQTGAVAYNCGYDGKSVCASSRTQADAGFVVRCRPVVQCVAGPGCGR